MRDQSRRAGRPDPEQLLPAGEQQLVAQLERLGEVGIRVARWHASDGSRQPGGRGGTLSAATANAAATGRPNEAIIT